MEKILRQVLDLDAKNKKSFAFVSNRVQFSHSTIQHFSSNTKLNAWTVLLTIL